MLVAMLPVAFTLGSGWRLPGRGSFCFVVAFARPFLLTDVLGTKFDY